MKITASDTGYVLENARGETLALSDQELAELVRDAHRLIDPKARFQPLATMQIEDVILSLNAHHTEAILRLIGAGGTETAFAIPAEAVRKLAGAFARKADQIEIAQTKKIEH